MLSRRMFITLFVTLSMKYIAVSNGQIYPTNKKCNQVEAIGGFDVDCSGRHLTRVPDDLPTNTIKLDISDNEISQLDESSFSRYPNIRVLTAQRNKLLHIELQSLESVSHLDLSQNNLDVLDIRLQNLDNLIHLNLSNNLIGRSLPVAHQPLLQHMNNIEVVDLSYNNIRSPANIFRKNTKLRTIILRGNHLTDFLVDLKHSLDVDFIDLSWNEIESLSQGSMDLLGGYGLQLNLLLLNNSFRCDCDTQRFLYWLLSTDVQIDEAEKITCTFWGSNRDFTALVFMVSKLKDKCSANYILIILISGSGIILFVCAAASGLVYRYRWRFRYIYNLTKYKYGRYGGYMKVRSREQLKDFNFDAYVSCADGDRSILSELTNNLEVGHGYKLCVSDRDLPAGWSAEAGLIYAVNNSKRTLVVLSENYVSDEWCLFEFNMARMFGIYECRDVIVLLELSSLRNVPGEIRELRELDPSIVYPLCNSKYSTFWNRLGRRLG